MSYVRAVLIGVALALAMVAVVALAGCKNHKTYNTTVVEDPPAPSPCVPSITCSDDDAGYVTISGSVCEGVTTLESGSGKNKVVLQEGDFLFRQRACLGVHVYTLRDNDGVVLAQCVIDTDAQPEEIVGCIVQPESKVLMCHGGTEIKVDKAAVMAHLIAGDTLGACPPPVVECVDGPFESVETLEQE